MSCKNKEIFEDMKPYVKSYGANQIQDPLNNDITTIHVVSFYKDTIG